MTSRTLTILMLGALALAVPVSAQQPPPAEAQAGRAMPPGWHPGDPVGEWNSVWAVQGGARATFSLEARVTKGKPYTAEGVTEFVHVLADGNRIARKSTTRIYRDSDGRTRRETLSDSGNADVAQVIISDPASGTSLMLDPATRTARRMPAMLGMFAPFDGAPLPPRPGAMGMARAGIGATQFEWRTSEGPKGEPPEGATTQVFVNEPIASMPPHTITARSVALAVAGAEPVKEDLGQQTIEGVAATGTRTTTTIPAGAIGNEQPIVIVSEQWFSADLEVLVLTKHSDPRMGETTYRLNNITRTEPDRTLFAPPSDYTISEPAIAVGGPIKKPQ